MKINKVITFLTVILLIILGIVLKRYYAVEKLELIVKDYSFFEELPNPKLNKHDCYRNEGKQYKCRALLYKIEDKELVFKIKNELKDFIVSLNGNFAEKFLDENTEYIMMESEELDKWDILIDQEEDIYNMYVF